MEFGGMKREHDGGYGGREKRQRVDPSSVSASPVLHLRGVSPETSQQELVSTFSPFGRVVYVQLMPRFSQALVEMESLAESGAAMGHAPGFFLRGCQLELAYSRSQSINRNAPSGGAPSAGGAGFGAPMGGPMGGPGGIQLGGGGVSSGGDPASATPILLCVIFNPMYNITTDVIHQIMSPFGNVLRIVIFSKKQLQAMVEFDSPMAALGAKNALDGKDIYAGSCTLKIIFSTAAQLNVRRNDDKTRDYTNPSLPSGDGGGYGGGQGGGFNGPQGGGFNGPQGGMGGGYGAPPGNMGYPPQMGGFMGGPPSHGAPGMSGGFGGPQGQMQQQEGGNGQSVLFVAGLDPKVTCDKLFNLFSIYGNVHKVKILDKKPGSALVQFENQTHAEMALAHVHGAALYGQAIQAYHSKHPFIAGSVQSAGEVQLVKEYIGSPLNRFRQNPMPSKDICKPTTTLFFSNCPKEQTPESLARVFMDLGCSQPTQVRFFDITGKSNERKIGLVEFATVGEATDALAAANNYLVQSTHTLRLSFSTNTINSRSGAGSAAPPGASYNNQAAAATELDSAIAAAQNGSS